MTNIINRIASGLLEPRPGNHQIETSGNDFVDLGSQGQKVIKSRLSAGRCELPQRCQAAHKALVAAAQALAAVMHTMRANKRTL